MSEDQEVLVVPPIEKVNNKTVRMGLADQIRIHSTPNYELADRLKGQASSPWTVVVLSLGYGERKKVELPTKEIRSQYLERVRQQTDIIIQASRLFSTRRKQAKQEFMSVGERLLRKKLDRVSNPGIKYQSRFADTEPSQQTAEDLIQNIMQEDTGTVIVRDQIVDIFNSQGQGVRLRVISGEWFLQEFIDGASYIKPKNLRN